MIDRRFSWSAHGAPVLMAAALLVGCAGAPQPPATQAPTASAKAPSTQVPPQKATQLGLYMHPKEAAAAMAGEGARKTLFLDVRAPEEIMFVGMPTLVDANVPYTVVSPTFEYDATRKAYKMEANSGFLTEVAERLTAKGLAKTDRVILVCRSGDRSAKAADLLAKAGYTQVYSVIEGFEGDLSPAGRREVNGWKHDGLPWSYALPREKLSQLR